MTPNLLKALSNCVDKGGFVPGGEIETRYLQDWDKKSAPRYCDALLKPNSTAQVAAILKICHAHRIAVVTMGGNSGRSGGALAAADCTDYNGQVMLCLERMRAVRQIDALAKTITVEGGCVLEQVQTAADEAGFLFPLNLGAKGSCQIGGNLATNAGGVNVLRYGSARHLCLGVEAVLANGDTLTALSPLFKNNTGYDLSQLIIGSEGTLAVITAATLRLFAKTAPCLTAWVAPASVDSALTVLHRLQQISHNLVTGFELMPANLMHLLQQYRPAWQVPLQPVPRWNVLVEVGGNPTLQPTLLECLNDFLAEGLLLDAVVAQNEKTRQHFWSIRENLPIIQAEHGSWIKGDVALPLSAIARYISDLENHLQQLCPDGLHIIGFGHLGDGNLHVSVMPCDVATHNNSDNNANALNEKIAVAINELAHQHGGTFSAEHGVGQFKKAWLKKWGDATALTLMLQIKSCFDPHNILNPDCLFDR